MADLKRGVVVCGIDGSARFVRYAGEVVVEPVGVISWIMHRYVRHLLGYIHTTIDAEVPECLFMRTRFFDVHESDAGCLLAAVL